jgi:hypothetical protein
MILPVVIKQLVNEAFHRSAPGGASFNDSSLSSTLSILRSALCADLRMDKVLFNCCPCGE